MKKYLLLLAAAAAASSASAMIMQFDLMGTAGAGLLPGNEPSAPVSTGSGGEIGAGIWLDTSTNILTVNVGWGSGNGFTDLTGTASAAHFHGPADMVTNTGVALGLSSQPGSIVWDGSATSGSITGTVDLDTVAIGNGSSISDLMNGMWYLNVHTAANPGGEIRGTLVPVPEPATTAAGMGLLAGLVAFALRRRRA